MVFFIMNEKKYFKHYINLIQSVKKSLEKDVRNLICMYGIKFICILYFASKKLNFKIIAFERRSPNDLPFIWGKITRN